MFNAINDPNKYDPLSPKNIVAFGKLNSKKETKITIWAAIIIASCSLLFSKFKNKSTVLIISACIAKRPLNPSIRFAPLIINRKQSRRKKIENISF